MKHFLAAFLALAMLVSLCSCNGGQASDPAESTAAPTIESTEALAELETNPEQLINIVEKGEAKYRIVYPCGASESIANAAQALCDAIYTATGVVPEINIDLVTTTEKGNATIKKEILIGKTQYTESTEALSNCPYGDYAIQTVENKLVIIANEEDALLHGCSYFSGLISQYGSVGSLSIPVSALSLRRVSNKTISALPIFSGTGTVQTLDAGDGAYMLAVKQSDLKSFREYRKKIVAAGYTLYTSHSATGNEFYTYVNDEYTIHTYYRFYDRSVRAIIEPKGMLPLTEPEAYEIVTTPSLTMVGVEISTANNGLCLIFRLSNGHFIILDSGHDKKSCTDKIYAKLQELAPDKNNIVVDAWFISHGHVDHAGGLFQIAMHYADSITVKQFICNIPPEERLLAIDDLTTENKTRNTMKTFQNAVITKAHTGQIYYFADAKVEILYTVEDVYPTKLADGNSASMVFRVTLGGQTIMCLGDEHTDSSSILTSTYLNQYLKSDIVQMSHHGMTGATAELYAQINPDVALWPSGITTYRERKDTDYNKKLLSLIKDLYIAGSTGVTLQLPYTIKNNKDSYT